MKHPNRFSLTRFLGAIAVALLIAWPAVAQEQTGSIQGTVKDPAGGVLPGAAVEAKSPVGSTTSVSDAAGKYRFPALPPSRYSVTASLSGFSPATVQNIEVALGQSKTVDLPLALAGVAAEVRVTGEAPLIDVTQSARFVTIREDQIQKLPKGRDFTTLVTQAPGAVQESKAGGISIDGASGSENRFIIDGIETTQLITGVSGKVLLTDFVDEIQVKSSGFQAEFGGATGGVINVITKTGTNEFKGDVGVYYTSDNLEGDERQTLRRNLANSAIAEYVIFRKDDFDRWEPGVSLGGSIVKDKVWFFAAYQPTLIETNRTVTLRANQQTITRTEDFRRDNGSANLTSQFTDRLRGKVAFNLSSSETEGLLPARDGTTNPLTNFDVTREDPNWSLSGNLDMIASNNLYFGLRGGYFLADVKQSGIFQGDRYIFQTSNVGLAGVPPEFQRTTGFTNQLTNSQTTRDEKTRLSFQLDGTWYATWVGEHALKAGVQYDRIGNDVLSGETGNRVNLFWNQTLDGQRGQFGYYTVRSNAVIPQRGIITVGDIRSDNIGIFLQDSWTIGRRLTLNLGVRTDREKIPSFTTQDFASGAAIPETAIEFDFEDKIAPRLGLAWDVKGDAKWKVYGSWGIFYDYTKLEMPRGSFGGDKWLEWYFRLDQADWTTLAASPNCPPACAGSLIRPRPIDFRHASNAPDANTIDPDIQPFEQQEFVFGIEHELAPVISVSARYVHKELKVAIEDIGSLDADQNEIYTIGNPGFGAARRAFGDVPFPKAVRDYDGAELSFNKRLSRNWALRLSYLWSRLWGNYSGLANSDENGRTSPNVNRVFDYPLMAFNEQGKPVYGILATDRPHQGKLHFLYDFPFGTSVGLQGYVGSGIPITREAAFIPGNNFPVQYKGRNSDGRTPTLSQVDLYAQHEFKVGPMGLVLSVNVLNLLDQDIITNRFPTELAPGVAIDISEADFYRGFDAQALIRAQNLEKDPRFLMDSEFQAPRQIRLGAKLTF